MRLPAPLQRLTTDRLGIERSFARDLQVNQQGSAIVHGILTAARSWGLRVMAEDIEAVAPRDKLLAMAFAAGPGDRFAPARPPAEALA